jgi:hypothetical protein
MAEIAVDLQELLSQLRETVAARRASGEYPEGMEEDLDAHFQRIVASRPGLPKLAVLRRRVDHARLSARFSAARIPASSELPGGQAIHRGLAKVLRRQVEGVLLQVQEFADRTLEALDAVVAVVERPDNHRHDDLVEVLDAHSEALARRDRAPQPPVDRLDDLLRRVESLEAAEATRTWRPWFTRERFEAEFGDGGRRRLAGRVAGLLDPARPAIDLTDGAEDPVAVLAGCPPAEASGIVLLGADDRVTAAGLVDLIGLAADKMQPGGRLVISSGAPPAAVGSEPGDRAAPPRFSPSLGSPLPAAYVAFVCREAGFAAIDTETWPGSGYFLVATR